LSSSPNRDRLVSGKFTNGQVGVRHLTQHFRGVSDVLRVCETAMTTKAKRDFVKKMHSSNAEGFVCKNRNAAYAGGRAGQHLKCKFVVTASFIVGPKPE
jgi:ATP-dependent DNA ligase